MGKTRDSSVSPSFKVCTWVNIKVEFRAVLAANIGEHRNRPACQVGNRNSRQCLPDSPCRQMENGEFPHGIPGLPSGRGFWGSNLVPWVASGGIRMPLHS